MKLKNFIYGLIIGIGFIIPGVSGGILATILGIYDEIVFRLNHFFKNFISNILYITPIIIGILISIFAFSKLIIYLLFSKLIFISYVFIGLILGCIPYLIEEIKIKTNKNIAIIPFLLSIIIGIFLYILEKNLPTINDTPTQITMFISGFIYALGKIIPGISGAALLMLIGVYEYFLNIIANPLLINIDLIISFIPFIISLVFSGIVILKLISYLLEKHFRFTYSLIIGFVISSVLFIYPNYFSLSYLLVAILAFIISYYLSQKY